MLQLIKLIINKIIGLFKKKVEVAQVAVETEVKKVESDVKDKI